MCMHSTENSACEGERMANMLLPSICNLKKKGCAAESKGAQVAIVRYTKPPRLSQLTYLPTT